MFELTDLNLNTGINTYCLGDLMETAYDILIDK